MSSNLKNGSPVLRTRVHPYMHIWQRHFCDRLSSAALSLVTHLRTVIRQTIGHVSIIQGLVDSVVNQKRLNNKLTNAYDLTTLDTQILITQLWSIVQLICLLLRALFKYIKPKGNVSIMLYCRSNDDCSLVSRDQAHTKPFTRRRLTSPLSHPPCSHEICLVFTLSPHTYHS